MTKLTIGFKLFQPWANEVVKGNMPYLVRSFNTNKRERVAVIASRNLDKRFFLNSSNDDFMKNKYHIGAIGSVEIKDCVEVNLEQIKNKLIRLAGKKYFDQYPKYLIPRFTRNRKAFIWVLDKPCNWEKPISVEGGGTTWVKLDLIDK